VPPSVARALVIALGTLLLVAGAAAAAHVSEQTVHDVASELRCVVCQNLSVADSPSEMAAQMRAIVRERLEAGETPEQVREYFVARYGEWILLAPRRVGFNLIVWGFPVAAMAVGFGVVALLLDAPASRRAGAAAGGRGHERAHPARAGRRLMISHAGAIVLLDHGSGVREAGSGRGWPALDGSWLRSTAPSNSTIA